MVKITQNTAAFDVIIQASSEKESSIDAWR